MADQLVPGGGGGAFKAAERIEVGGGGTGSGGIAEALESSNWDIESGSPRTRKTDFWQRTPWRSMKRATRRRRRGSAMS